MLLSNYNQLTACVHFKLSGVEPQVLLCYKLAMQKKKTLTIIIPTFNSEDYLSRTLECLKNQQTQNFSVLIIDDNSKDTTAKITKKFPTVHFFSKPKNIKKGAAASISYALKKVATPYVALIDSDTYLNSNWTDTMEKILKKEDIAGAPILADNQNGLVAYLAGLEIENRYGNLPVKVSHLSTCNLAFRAPLVKDFVFDENLYYAYDHQLSFYLKRNHIKFYLSKKTSCYHGNKNSLKNYLLQQYNITKNHTVLAKKMPREALGGDEISPNYLILQPPLTLLMFGAMFYNLNWALVFFVIILFLNHKFLIYLNKKTKTLLLLPAIGLIILRNLMWTFGFMKGLTK